MYCGMTVAHASHLDDVVLPLQADLREDAGQQFVDVVIDAHRHLDELDAERARQALAICGVFM